MNTLTNGNAIEEHADMNLLSDTISSEDLSDVEDSDDNSPRLERDFYGCYCLKFRVEQGTLITEAKIAEDFGVYGEVVDIWGAGFVDKRAETCKDHKMSNFDSEVYVRFYKKAEAEGALLGLEDEYRELTPAISDVLRDNAGLYTISFINKVSVSYEQIKSEFSIFGKIANIYGELETRGGRVHVAFLNKDDAIKAFLNKTERWYPAMRFNLPQCDRDYTGCYCLRFFNRNLAPEQTVRTDFGRYGDIVDLRGSGLFDVGGVDVYVRYKEKASAQHALTSLSGEYDGLCITPAVDIYPDKFGSFSVTFINHSEATETEIWEMFKKFGKVKNVNGTFNSNTGRIFVSMVTKEGLLAAMADLVGSKDFHLKLAKPNRYRGHYTASKFIKSPHSLKRKSIDNMEEQNSGKKRRSYLPWREESERYTPIKEERIDECSNNVRAQHKSSYKYFWDKPDGHRRSSPEYYHYRERRSEDRRDGRRKSEIRKVFLKTEHYH